MTSYVRLGPIPQLQHAYMGCLSAFVPYCTQNCDCVQFPPQLRIDAGLVSDVRTTCGGGVSSSDVDAAQPTNRNRNDSFFMGELLAGARILPISRVPHDVRDGRSRAVVGHAVRR